MKPQETQLKVMEALQEEAYKGIVRIDSQTMRSIKIRPGDIVEIEGNRKTVGIADRAYPSDVGQGIIRMDGILRRNAKTGIGENVIIRKAEVQEAKTVTIAPAQKGVRIEADPRLLKKGLLGRAVVKGDILALGGTSRRQRTMMGSPFEDIFDVFEQGFLGNFGLGGIKFVVADVNPKGSVVIGELTNIKLSHKAVEVVEEKIIDVTYEDIGGLSDEIKKIREMVELPLRHPEVFNRLGIKPPAGVLLHGPPGTGKTLLAKAVANESDSHFMLLNGPEIMNKFYGESERKIRELFEEAEKNSPAIIFIDEIDAIAPKREEVHGEVERRVVSQLLTMMDGLKSRNKVIVIGATNRPNAIDPALRRPGRFDREIEIGIPDKKGRLDILKIHTRNMPIDKKDVNLDKISELTHGFVGADLNALSKEAAMHVLRRNLPEIKMREKDPISEEVLNKMIIKDKDFKEALKVVRPSVMREVLIETPNVKWEQIGGLDEVKANLKESVEWPLEHADAFKNMGIKPPTGILLYGPPGTGKTLLAKAVANESQANFILVQGPTLLNRWVGESEKGLRKIFEKARQASPCVVFFDEIDSIASSRGRGSDGGSNVTERMVNTLLSEMDGLQEMNDVVVIAATNRPDIIDPALLRPGRFDRIILVNVPDEKARESIFKIHTNKMPLNKDVDLGKLVKSTENYVGADIENLCREAGMLALREDMKSKEVKMKHFEEALTKVKSSIRVEDIKRYMSIEDKYLRTARGAAIAKADYVG